MRILKVLKALWKRHKRTERIRKQMQMTKKCSRELDILLGIIGIDYSSLEPPCPIPAEVENEIQNEERWRD